MARFTTIATSVPAMPENTPSQRFRLRSHPCPYKDKGIRFLEELNGIFAFALYDEETDDYLIARDPVGVIPLYIGRDKDGHIYFGSELKALEGFCQTR